MPIQIYWDNEEKTIIRADFDAEWTWEEYQDGVALIVEMNQDIPHRIHQLIDMRNSIKVPAQAATSNILRGRRSDPKNLGATVVVAPPKIIEIFMNVIEKAYNTRFPERWMVQTVEEAYQRILEYDLENPQLTEIESKNSK